MSTAACGDSKVRPSIGCGRKLYALMTPGQLGRWLGADPLLNVTSYGLVHTRETVPVHFRKKLPLYSGEQAGPFEGEGRVQLHKRCAGADLDVSVGARKYPADADQHQSPSHAVVRFLQKRRGRGKQRRAGQSAGFAGVPAPEARS